MVREAIKRTSTKAFLWGVDKVEVTILQYPDDTIFLRRSNSI